MLPATGKPKFSVFEGQRFRLQEFLTLFILMMFMSNALLLKRDRVYYFQSQSVIYSSRENS